MWSKILFSAAAVVHAVDHHDLHLLQQNVKERTVEDDFMQVGYKAPMSEAGYQSVASLKSDRATEVFIERVALAEARTIKDAGELSGLAPYYSGTRGVQSLDNLKKELRAAPWVGEGEGRRVPLDEDGYQAVISTNSEAHMVAFARRILDAHGLESNDEGMLRGLLPWFDGRRAVQSFEKLQTELLAAAWAEPRNKSGLSLADKESTKPTEVQALKEDAENVTTKVHVLKEDPEKLKSKPEDERNESRKDEEKKEVKDEKNESRQEDEKKEKKDQMKDFKQEEEKKDENKVSKQKDPLAWDDEVKELQEDPVSEPGDEMKELKQEGEKKDDPLAWTVSNPEDEMKEFKQKEEKKESKPEGEKKESKPEEEKKDWFSWFKRWMQST